MVRMINGSLPFLAVGAGTVAALCEWHGRSRIQPVRAKDNGPAIYRWVDVNEWTKSRSDGRTLRFVRDGTRQIIFRPCGTLVSSDRLSSDKSLGYSRSSLRDSRNRSRLDSV